MTLPVVPGGDGLTNPVNSIQDVIKEFPSRIAKPAVAPVRDAIAAGIYAVARKLQDAAQVAAGCISPEEAEGTYLDAILADHDMYRQGDDSDDRTRARLYSSSEQVSPNAIIDKVNEILATVTLKTAVYAESEMDCIYVEDGTAVWQSFVGTNPTYYDRLYPDDLAANGYSIPRRNPGGMVVFDSSGGRHFHLRIPALDNINDNITVATDGTEASLEPSSMWVGDGSDTGGAETAGTVAISTFAGSFTEEEIFDRIVSEVDIIVAQGFRWSIDVDPNL